MEHSLFYCVDIQDLIEKLKTVYNPSDWRLSIDASKSSLKAVLLCNRNQFASISFAYLACIKESQENFAVELTIWLSLTRGKCVLILRSYICYCVNSLDLRNILVLHANRTAGTGVIIGLNMTGH